MYKDQAWNSYAKPKHVHWNLKEKQEPAAGIT
jgi:hypothetical protein